MQLGSDSGMALLHQSNTSRKLDDKSGAFSSERDISRGGGLLLGGLALSCNTARSKSRNRALNNPQGLSVFKGGGGIFAQLTPVSKKFAPSFASTHSLVANTVCHNTEQALKDQGKEIRANLVPKSESHLKDLNQLVDTQLKQVVDRINLKKELEKKQRELAPKL